MFNLKDDHRNIYTRLIINLYRSKLEYFICDDKALEYVQLYWQNPTEEDDKKLDKKTRTERYIHELRVMRKIFQDLLWGDAADEYYAKIMDKQTDLELFELWRDFPVFILSVQDFFQWLKSPIKKSFKKLHFIKYLKGVFSRKMLFMFHWFFIKRLLFKVCFGWGVRLERALFSGAGAIAIFTLIYWLHKIKFYIGDKFEEKLMNTQNLPAAILFSVWNFFNIFLPDAQVISLKSSVSILLITGEAFLGIVWITLLVAIISRKFMRL